MDILATNSNNTTTCHLNFMYKPSVVSCGAAEWFFIAISVAYHSHVHGRLYSLMILSKPPLIYSPSQQGAHLGSTGPRWAPYWPHESCYQRCSFSECSLRYSRSEQIGRSIADKIFMYIFLAGNSVYSNFTELCFWGPIDNISVLVHGMAWGEPRSLSWPCSLLRNHSQGAFKKTLIIS